MLLGHSIKGESMKKFLIATLVMSSIALSQDAKIPEKIELNTSTINAVLQYLNSKPRVETNGLVLQIEKEAHEYIQKLNAAEKKKEIKKATKKE